MRAETKKHYIEIFDKLRNEGAGEGIGEDNDTVEEAVERVGWTVLSSRAHTGDILIAVRPDGMIMGVGDIYGPWVIRLGWKEEMRPEGYFVMPRDAGQIVEISYKVDYERDLLFKKALDRSDNSTTFYVAEITELEDYIFEPQNNHLPDHGEFKGIKKHW